MRPEHGDLLELGLRHKFWTWSTNLRSQDVSRALRTKGYCFCNLQAKRDKDMKPSFLYPNPRNSTSQMRKFMSRRVS